MHLLRISDVWLKIQSIFFFSWEPPKTFTLVTKGSNGWEVTRPKYIIHMSENSMTQPIILYNSYSYKNKIRNILLKLRAKWAMRVICRPCQGMPANPEVHHNFSFKQEESVISQRALVNKRIPSKEKLPLFPGMKWLPGHSSLENNLSKARGASWLGKCLLDSLVDQSSGPRTQVKPWM